MCSKAKTKLINDCTAETLAAQKAASSAIDKMDDIDFDASPSKVNQQYNAVVKEATALANTYLKANKHKLPAGVDLKCVDVAGDDGAIECDTIYKGGKVHVFRSSENTPALEQYVADNFDELSQ